MGGSSSFIIKITFLRTFSVSFSSLPSTVTAPAALSFSSPPFTRDKEDTAFITDIYPPRPFFFLSAALPCWIYVLNFRAYMWSCLLQQWPVSRSWLTFPGPLVFFGVALVTKETDPHLGFSCTSWDKQPQRRTINSALSSSRLIRYPMKEDYWVFNILWNSWFFFHWTLGVSAWSQQELLSWVVVTKKSIQTACLGSIFSLL